ncbi:MAG: TrbI/VirB10 family protein [Crocosphaera sp.]
MNSSYSTQDIFNLLDLKTNQGKSTSSPQSQESDGSIKFNISPENNQEIDENFLTDKIEDNLDGNPTQTQNSFSTRNQKSFSRNPYVKFALISLVVGSVAIFLGLLFAQGNLIYSTFSKDSSLADSSSNGVNNPEKQLDETDSLEERNAKLSGELALAEQNDQIKAIKDKLDNEKDIPTVSVEKPKTNPTPAATPVVKTQTPTPRVQQPQPIKNVVSQPPRQIATPRPPQPQSLSPVQQRDPIEQWQQLAQLGSYGGGQQVNQVLIAQTQPQPQPNSNNNILEVDSLPQTTLVSQSLGTSLPLGQQVSGVLSTPIAVPVDLRNATGDFVFMVTLEEPLKSHQNETVLKAGSTVIFAVSSVQSGIIDSRAVAVISDGQEWKLDNDALQIRLSNGSPLIAKLKDNYSGEIARRDGATFVMGALTKAGELANRATSTSTFSGIGGVSSTSTYNEPNYVGAVIEGGFGPLTEQWQQRNQQAIGEMQNLSRLWWLDAGIPVQIWVTRSVELGGIDVQNP